MKILVTGAAGFIGFAVAKQLVERGDDVVGFDNMNDYYDPSLKFSRIEQLEKAASQATGTFEFVQANLADLSAVESCFKTHAFDRVIHLAAQAGVRYSLENPYSYIESNVLAFTNILEACRHAQTPHLTYASSSSVYGANTIMPFSEEHAVDHPLQLYAVTKRSNELMAHSYSHLFKLPTTGLRFFTVYGPWGRPDMALFKFTKNILEDKAIPVFNHGNHTRDFTFVDDIVEGVIRVSDKIATSDETWSPEQPSPAKSHAPFRIFNIGNNNPVQLIEYIRAIEKATGKTAQLDLLPMQPGDVPDTFADSNALAAYVDYRPATTVDDGVKTFVDWYRDYYRV